MTVLYVCPLDLILGSFDRIYKSKPSEATPTP